MHDGAYLIDKTHNQTEKQNTKVRPVVTSDRMDDLTVSATRKKTQTWMPQMLILEVYHHSLAGTHYFLVHGPNQSSYSSVNPEKCNEKERRLHNNVTV